MALRMNSFSREAAHFTKSRIHFTEAATRGVLRKKVFLKILQNSACNFIKKETLAQVLSSEFCKISKSTLFTEHLRTTAFIVDCFPKNFQNSRSVERLSI